MLRCKLNTALKANCKYFSRILHEIWFLIHKNYYKYKWIHKFQCYSLFNVLVTKNNDQDKDSNCKRVKEEPIFVAALMPVNLASMRRSRWTVWFALCLECCYFAASCPSLRVIKLFNHSLQFKRKGSSILESFLSTGLRRTTNFMWLAFYQASNFVQC